MLKQTIKNIVKKIGEESAEFIKDSARQVGKTISPTEMLKQATGTQNNEFSDYLKNLSDKDLTPQQLELKQKEQTRKDEEEAKKLRLFLQSTPTHLRSAQKPEAPRPYEAAMEQERKKAEAVEAQKKQQQPLSMPTSKQSRGMLGAKKKPKSSDFEAGKNIKVG